MEQEQNIILCQYLKIAEKGKIPPVVCIKGFNPTLNNYEIWAGKSCPLVKEGYCSWHCQQIRPEPTSPAVK